MKNGQCIDKPAYFGCVDLKYSKDGSVYVLELGDGHTSGFTGSGARLPELFRAFGYGRRPVTPILDAFIENKALTHYAFLDAGFAHLRPASVLCKRAYDPGLAELVLAAVGGGPCVLKLLDRSRGCGIVPVSPDDLDATLRTLLLHDYEAPHVQPAPGELGPLTNEWVSIAQKASIQGDMLEEQALHWRSDECPFFLAEALCESRFVKGADGMLYDGTLRVAFVLEEGGEVKLVGSYWKLPGGPADSVGVDMTYRLLSHTKGGSNTAPCTADDEASIWMILESALPKVLDFNNKRFTIPGLLSRFENEPLLLSMGLARIAGGLAQQNSDEASHALLLAEQLLSDEKEFLLHAGRSYVLRTKGTLLARRPGKAPNWPAADKFYNEALELLPYSAAAAYLVGMGCFSRGSYKVAGQLFAASLAADCDFASAYSYLATCCLLLKVPAAAVSVSEAMIVRHCTLAAGYHHLAVSLYAQEAACTGHDVARRRRAAESLQKARELQRGKSWAVEDDNMLELLSSDKPLPTLPVRTWLYHSWRL